MFNLKKPAPDRRGPLSTLSLGLIGALPIALGALAVPETASANLGTFTTLYKFLGTHSGGGLTDTDGCAASSSLIFDSAGNLYGETESGGAPDYGTVFSLFPGNSADVVLHAFQGYNQSQNTGEGKYPTGSLIFDSAGNLYGTTFMGGSATYGTVFKLAPNGTLTTLHNFANGSDGNTPLGGLVSDSAGNLYGTTSGDYAASTSGTVFKIAPNGTFTTLYTFTGGTDGAIPSSDLVLDKAGNLYGTTITRGTFGYGTVFELTTGGQLLALHAFQGGSDGGYPVGGVVFDAAGSLYGTTNGEGSFPGTVFKLTPNGTSNSPLVTLHTFQSGSDGDSPSGDLIFDSAGSLYGSTSAGGATGNGTAFRLIPGSGAFTVLASLPEPGGGYNYELTLDSTGTLYGTNGGLGFSSSCGIVYSIAGVAAPGPKLTASPSTLSFQAGNAGSTQSVTIGVKGGNYISKTPLLTGPNADEFSITSNSCTGTIASGSSCSISMVYSRNPAEQASNQNSSATLNLTGDATLAIPLVGKPPVVGNPPGGGKPTCPPHSTTCS